MSTAFFVAVFFFFCSSYVVKNLTKLNQNTRRCKYRSGSVLSYFSLPYRLAAAQVSVQLSGKEGWNYVDYKREVDKLHTARGQKTSQILGPRRANVLLALRKDPESVIVQDPWFSQLDWSPKRETKRKDRETPKWHWNLTRPKKGLPPGAIDLTARNRIAPFLFRLAWGGYPLFHSREYGCIYRVPSSVSETSKHGSSLTFSNFADSTLADLVLQIGS